MPPGHRNTQTFSLSDHSVSPRSVWGEFWGYLSISVLTKGIPVLVQVP